MYTVYNRYIVPKVIVTFIIEFGLLIALSMLVIYISAVPDESGRIEFINLLINSAVVAVANITALYFNNVFNLYAFSPRWQLVKQISRAATISTISLIPITYILGLNIIMGWALALNVMLLILTMLSWRIMFANLLGVNVPDQNILVIGSGEFAKKIGVDIYTRKERGLHLIGFIDHDPLNLGKPMVNPGVIGVYDDIKNIVERDNISKIIVAPEDRRIQLPMDDLLDLKLKGISVEEGETFKERLLGKIPIQQLKPSWMVFSDGFKPSRFKEVVKRISDLLLSVILLVIALPIMILTAIAIKIESRGPVIYSQKRVGALGRIFTIYKFRSMKIDAEDNSGPVWASQNDSRTTRVGGILRKSRIDELPQLINVFKGEMSFVGPRPERPCFVEELEGDIPYFKLRTYVKPGITGWAQIKYKYGATVEDAIEKLQYDLFYIKNMSMALDIYTVLCTVKVVLARVGAR